MKSEGEMVPAALDDASKIFSLIHLSLVNCRKVSSFPEAQVNSSKIQQLQKGGPAQVQTGDRGFAEASQPKSPQSKTNFPVKCNKNHFHFSYAITTTPLTTCFWPACSWFPPDGGRGRPVPFQPRAPSSPTDVCSSTSWAA